MKRLPEITPPHRTASGRVRCGSLISSPMTDASSRPTSAKQITPKEFRTARGSWGIRKSAAVIVSPVFRSEEHTSELQSPDHLVCRLLLEKKKKRIDD